ncbi:hypothetical protein Tco_1547996 [Tanacetum coccineum]
MGEAVKVGKDCVKVELIGELEDLKARDSEDKGTPTSYVKSLLLDILLSIKESISLYSLVQQCYLAIVVLNLSIPNYLFTRLQDLDSREIVSRSCQFYGSVSSSRRLKFKFLKKLASCNFKIVKQDVKKSVGASRGAQNLAFMTAPSTSSTNDVNTCNTPILTNIVAEATSG